MSTQRKHVIPFFAPQHDDTAMSDDVADMLSALCQATGRSFDQRLSMSDASKLIDELRDKLDFQLRSASAANSPGKVTSSNEISLVGDA